MTMRFARVCHLQKTTVMRRTVKQASGPSSIWYGEYSLTGGGPLCMRYF